MTKTSDLPEPSDHLPSPSRKPGAFYGVGVGPGDPELMTLKAARLIGQADVVAYPTLPGGPSLSRTIASGAIRAGTEELQIEVPMTAEREPAQAAYDEGAMKISAHLAAGRDVVYLCEGDPFFYGSFMYLHARLSRQFATATVPGVSSVNAGAAMAGLPLAARNEVLSILPAPLPDDVLRARLAGCSAAVIMKVGRHLPRLRRLLDAEGLTPSACYIERASMEDERVLPLSAAPDDAPYFSMILVVKGADPWL